MDEIKSDMETLSSANDMRNDNMQNMALAMAYVPIQQWETPFEAEVGFTRGTLFPSLDKPYTGEAVR